MENDLVSIYENSYLNNGSILEEKKGRAGKADINEDGEISQYEAKRSSAINKNKTKSSFKNKGVKKKSMSKKSISDKEMAGITYDSFNRSENIFDKILREMDEMGGNMDSSVGNEDDNVFDADGESSNEDEVSYTLSELRAMTLGEIVDLLGEGGEEEGEGEEDEYGYGGEGEMESGDSVPGESYSAGGESNYHGDQGNYDGKAKRQPSTTRVKSNGDADFSQAKTGMKTSSGKKDKNYF